MKLRIKGNSLRLRLSRGEAERFGETGRITESIRFGASPNARLSYVLAADGNAKQIAAHYADNQIIVVIPAKAARNWVDSELIALTGEQPIENGEQNGTNISGASENVLKILIEKDFARPNGKDDPDNADAFIASDGKMRLKICITDDERKEFRRWQAKN